MQQFVYREQIMFMCQIQYILYIILFTIYIKTVIV